MDSQSHSDDNAEVKISKTAHNDGKTESCRKTLHNHKVDVCELADKRFFERAVAHISVAAQQ